MKLNQVALQLYTLRNHLKTPADISASLTKVREIGYEAVQVSGLGPIEDRELVKICDGEGLKICATHESGDDLFQRPNEVVDHLNELGCTLTAYPFPAGIDFSSEESVSGLIRNLNAAGKVLHEAGMILTYHNHNHEFRKFGGTTILDRIYDQTDPRYLQGELDTYWVQYGGASTVDYCEKLKGRLPMIHLKDYKVTDDNKHDFAEIGAGNMNFPKIIAAAEDAGCEWFIVEQDTCPGDEFESCRISFDYIKAHLCS